MIARPIVISISRQFTGAFVRSTAGIVAVIVVPKVARWATRRVPLVRRAAAAASSLEANIWHQALKGCRWMGAGAEARAARYQPPTPTTRRKA